MMIPLITFAQEGIKQAVVDKATEIVKEVKTEDVKEAVTKVKEVIKAKSEEAKSEEAKSEDVKEEVKEEAKEEAKPEPTIVGGADINDLIKAVGGVKGGGTLAIIMLVVQLIMWLLKGFFANVAGKWKLIAVLGLTLVAGIIAMMMQGVTLGASLLHSSTIASAQVLLNQAYKQFLGSKKETKA